MTYYMIYYGAWPQPESNPRGVRMPAAGRRQDPAWSRPVFYRILSRQHMRDEYITRREQSTNRVSTSANYMKPSDSDTRFTRLVFRSSSCHSPVVLFSFIRRGANLHVVQYHAYTLLLYSYTCIYIYIYMF